MSLPFKVYSFDIPVWKVTKVVDRFSVALTTYYSLCLTFVWEAECEV